MTEGHDFYRDALDAEAFGHMGADILSRRNSNPPSIYTGIALELAGHDMLFKATGLPAPYYGA